MDNADISLFAPEPVAPSIHTNEQISIICTELHHLLNCSLENDLGQKRGLTYDATLTSWREHAHKFCNQLVTRGWLQVEAAEIFKEKNRLADMLELALSQRPAGENTRAGSQPNMNDHRADCGDSNRAFTVALL